jgi:ligand-binding SRPBCC domain-containing protein
MTSKVTSLERPRRFVDEQVRGPFRSFHHEHIFEAVEGGTRMVDRVRFEGPLGPIGRLVERAVLASYLERLITIRGSYLRDKAEGRGRAAADPPR